MKIVFKLLFLIILPLSLHAFHKVHNNSDESITNEDITFIDNMLNASENYLKYTYKAVNHFSKLLDENITNKYSDHTYTDSYIHVETYFLYKEGKSNDAGVNLSVKLRLPQLKDKFKLVFENTDNKAAVKYDDNNEAIPYEDDDFSLALQYDKLKKFYNFRIKAGAKLSSDPYIFINARVSKKFDLTKSWDLRLKEKMQAIRNQRDLTGRGCFHTGKP